MNKRYLLLLLCAVTYLTAGCERPKETAKEVAPAPAKVAEAPASVAEAPKPTPPPVPEKKAESAESKVPVTKPAEKPATASKKPVTPKKPAVTQAVIETKFGKIVLRLFPDVAPRHVKNFIELASKGFYDGTTFHRVIPGYIIQGGDPNSRDPNRALHGQGGPGYTINAEFNERLHKRGTLSMARARDPNSAGSQFFICVADAPTLDGLYTVFGEVVSGMEAVDRIAGAPRDSRDNPLDRIEMKVVVEARGATHAPATTVPVAIKVPATKTEKIDTSKLNKFDRKLGAGAVATAGKQVAVHYTGWLYDETKADHRGTKFDSSYNHGQAFEFGLGAGQVIPGWDQGVEGMKVGGQRTLIIPASLAYGARGAGGLIPPNAILVFDIELLGVR